MATVRCSRFTHPFSLRLCKRNLPARSRTNEFSLRSLAAALVVFFLAPLQRFSERVASVAMPNTENTPEYAAYRKMQVYESALADALLEGGISEKERSLLNTLRDTLGISASDAAALENDLQAHSA